MPPPPPPPKPAIRKDAPEQPFEVVPEDPVVVGDGIRPPVKLRDVRPLYPMIAQQAKVQGVVILEARIEADGRVSSAQVLRSIPLLDRAAVDAVLQWQYEPTLLNGRPVAIRMAVPVHFMIQ